MHVDVNEAETTLSKLIDKALKGEEIIIQKDDTEAVQLVPKPQPQEKEATEEPRKLGSWKGKIWMSPDFDELSDEEAEAFGIKDS